MPTLNIISLFLSPCGEQFCANLLQELAQRRLLLVKIRQGHRLSENILDQGTVMSSLQDVWQIVDRKWLVANDANEGRVK